VRSFFTRNIGWKLLSLAAAVLLWIAVASEPEVSTFVSVRVEYKNLAPGVEINSDVAESVILEVRGPSGELRGLPETRRLYGVVLDMSDVGPGQHTFTVAGGNVRLPRDVQLVRAVPAQVRLNFEHSALRNVPVEVRFAAALPPDLQVVAVTSEPAALAVAGPASRVAHVNRVETDPIDWKPMPGVAEYSGNAYVNDPRVRFQDPARVTVKVTVGESGANGANGEK
jgi:YbbR domain-containing protein